MPETLVKGCEFSGVSLAGTCGRAAVIVATGGCIHEHVLSDLLVCQYHTEEVAAGDSYCLRCFEVDGHDCPLAFDSRSIRDLEAAHPTPRATARGSAR